MTTSTSTGQLRIGLLSFAHVHAAGYATLLRQWPGVEFLRRVLLIVLIAAVALTEIQNYVAIFVDNAIYDPVTSYLMQALKMISARPQ